MFTQSQCSLISHLASHRFRWQGWRCCRWAVLCPGRIRSSSHCHRGRRGRSEPADRSTDHLCRAGTGSPGRDQSGCWTFPQDMAASPHLCRQGSSGPQDTLWSGLHPDSTCEGRRQQLTIKLHYSVGNCLLRWWSQAWKLSLENIAQGGMGRRTDEYFILLHNNNWTACTIKKQKGGGGGVKSTHISCQQGRNHHNTGLLAWFQ